MWRRCWWVACLFACSRLAEARAASAPVPSQATSDAGDASPAATSDLTLARAVEWALVENPELEALEASVAAAEGDSLTAALHPNPELDFAPGAVVSKGDAGREAGFHGELAIAQRIEFPGKRALRRAITAGNVRQRTIAMDGLRDQVALRVRRTFAEILVAREIVALRDQQRDIAQRFADAARRRSESGYGSEFEALESDVEVAAAARGVRAAQGELAAARVSLFALFGRQPTSDVREVGSLDALTRFPLPPDPVAFALTRNPELRVSREAAALAALEADAARLAGKPDLTIAPSAEVSADEQIYGLGFSVPLPIWDRNQGGVAAADAELRRARASVAALERDVAANVRAALERLRAARDQAELYTPELLERLRSLLERAERRYGQSATTFLIYLDARKTCFDTLADHYESLAAVAAAGADLEAAVGVPLDSADPAAPAEGARP